MAIVDLGMYFPVCLYRLREAKRASAENDVQMKYYLNNISSREKDID